MTISATIHFFDHAVFDDEGFDDDDLGDFSRGLDSVALVRVQVAWAA